MVTFAILSISAMIRDSGIQIDNNRNLKFTPAHPPYYGDNISHWDVQDHRIGNLILFYNV